MAHRVQIRFPGEDTFLDYTDFVFLPDEVSGGGQSAVGGASSQTTQQATLVKTWELGAPPNVIFFVGGTLGDLSSFRPPVHGCLVWIDSTTFPEFFTGYITNEVEVVPIGEDGKILPSDAESDLMGYVCAAQGEEIVLDMNLTGFIQPFVNLTVGGIIAALGETLLPGRFDWSGIEDFGDVVPVFVIPPQSTFSSIVSTLLANMAAKLWYKRGKAYLARYDEGDPTVEPTVSEVEADPENPLYNPYDLTIKPLSSQIINDVTGIGDTEPQAYCREYTIGDGITTNFPLKLPLFGTLGSPIVEDDFTATEFSTQIWAPFGTEPGDSSDPDGTFILSGSSLNVIGGLGYDTTKLLLAQGVEIKGQLEIDGGEFQFVNASDAIVSALLLSDTATLDQVKYGFKFSKNTTSPTTGSISETPEGIIDGTNLDFFTSENPIVSTLVVKVNGTTLTYGTDYTISINAITFTTPPPLGATINAAYDYEIGPQTDIQAIVDGALVGNVVTTKPGFTYSLRLQISTPAQQTNLPPWYSLDSAFGGGSQSAPVSVNFIVEEYSQLQVKDPNKLALYNVTQTGVPAFLFVCEFSVNDADFAVNYFEILQPIQGTLLTELVFDPDQVQRTLGFVGQPEADATISVVNELEQLSFFKQTVPQLRQLNEFRYRSAGPAVARVQDQASIAAEAARYGDTGLRSTLLTNITPLPANSAQLEWALQAYLDDNSTQQFQGSWVALTPPYTWTEEPIPGRFINVQCPSRTPEQVNVVGSPPQVGFSELIKVVTITVDGESDDGTLEHFEINFQYGFTVSRQMQKVLAQFVPPDPPAVATLRQISTVPPVDTTLVGTQFIEDAPNANFYDRDFQFYYMDVGQDLLEGEQVEVRYSDASWGTPGGANLVGRFSTRQFTISRRKRDLTVFCKIISPSGSPGIYTPSRYPSMLRVEYPLVPPQPAGFSVNSSNIYAPRITFELPPDTRDLFGILIQDQRTEINSQVTLVSSDVGDTRDMKISGQDANGNYIFEVLQLNGTTPVTSVKTYAYILWVQSYYGTVINEVPTPPTDGSTLNFTLRNTPIPGSAQVWLDSQAQTLGVTYNIVGNQVQFVPTAPPITGSEIQVSYLYATNTTAAVTISAGMTGLGTMAVGALQWLANPILYRYEDLSFGGSASDPALTFVWDNPSAASTHDFIVYFYNLLDELSLAYETSPSFVSPVVGNTECLDVRAFGAVGDGVTDDTTAVQSALDQAHANYLALVALGSLGSPGAVGPTKVCIPSGVLCNVGQTLNRYGGNPVTIQSGVTLQVDGALIQNVFEQAAIVNEYAAANGLLGTGTPTPTIGNTIEVDCSDTAYTGPVELFGVNVDVSAPNPAATLSMEEEVDLTSGAGTSTNFFESFLCARFPQLSAGQTLNIRIGSISGTIIATANPGDSEIVIGDHDITIIGGGQIVAEAFIGVLGGNVAMGNVVRFTYDGPTAVGSYGSSPQTPILTANTAGFISTLHTLETSINDSQVSVSQIYSDRPSVDGCKDARLGSGILMAVPFNMNIANNRHSSGNAQSGLLVLAVGIVQGTIVNNHFDGFGINGISLVAVNSGVTFSAIRVVGNECSGAGGNVSVTPGSPDTGGDGIYIEGGVNVAVTSNTLNGNVNSAIHTKRCSNCTISDNGGTGNGVDGVTDDTGAPSTYMSEDNPEWNISTFVQSGVTVNTTDAVSGETPTGLVNGINDTFTLAHAPSPPYSLVFTIDGVPQVVVTDYLLSGNTITTTNPPAIGATLLADYTWAVLSIS